MLAWILAAGAILCLAYYVVILVYSGIGTSHAVIWLMFAFGLGAAFWSVRSYQRDSERFGLRIPVTLVTLCAAGTLILLIAQILILSAVPSVAEQRLDYLIVLGAQLDDGQPTKILRLRLDKAAEYARENPETVLVLSGGQTGGQDETEASVMQAYLLEKGVPEDRMLLEQQSTSTMENIAYSRQLIDQQRESRRSREHGVLGGLPIQRTKPDEPGLGRMMRVGILTSNFQLYRASKIAKHQGFVHVSGIACQSDQILFLHFCFRDSLALLKERIVGNL